MEKVVHSTLQHCAGVYTLWAEPYSLEPGQNRFMNFAEKRGLIDEDPCKQVRRNLEQPRSEAPPSDVAARFAD